MTVLEMVMRLVLLGVALACIFLLVRLVRMVRRHRREMLVMVECNAILDAPGFKFLSKEQGVSYMKFSQAGRWSEALPFLQYERGD